MSPQDFIAPLFAMVGSGLVSSLGLSYLVRRPYAVARIEKLGGKAVVAVVVVVLAVAGAGLSWLYQSFVASLDQQELSISTLQFVVFGLSIGMPFALPAFAMTWWELKQSEKKKRTKPPSKADRQKLVDELQGQFEELGGGRHIKLRLDGEHKTILRIDGEMPRAEGDKLTAALRGELRDLGFERVEGSDKGKDWWSRVGAREAGGGKRGV